MGMNGQLDAPVALKNVKAILATGREGPLGL
jgi:hypothetical protein